MRDTERAHGRTTARRRSPQPAPSPPCCLPVAEALPLLARARRDPAAHPATACWGAAALHALHLVARGRLLPGLTADDHDAWRAGPLDAGRHRPPAGRRRRHAVRGPRGPAARPRPAAAARARGADAVLPRRGRRHPAAHPGRAVRRGTPFAARAAAAAAATPATGRPRSPPAWTRACGSRCASTCPRTTSSTTREEDGAARSAGRGRRPGAQPRRPHPRRRRGRAVGGRRRTRRSGRAPGWTRCSRCAARPGSGRRWTGCSSRTSPTCSPLSEDELYDLLGAGGDPARPRPGSPCTGPGSWRARPERAAPWCGPRPARRPTAPASSTARNCSSSTGSWRSAATRSPRREMDTLAEAHRPIVRLRDQWVLVDPALVRKARKRELGLLDPVDALAVGPHRHRRGRRRDGGGGAGRRAGALCATV